MTVLLLPLLLLLPLVGGPAALAAARSLNAPQDAPLPEPQTDRTDRPRVAVTGVGRQQRLLLEKTRPFILVDGQRRSVTEALQDGHPDHLQCELWVAGHLFLLDLEKNHELLPSSPSVYFYLPNGTAVAASHSVTHCYYHGSVRGFPRSRVALSTCSGLRGIIVINSTLSFELQPQDLLQGEEQEEGGASGSGGGEGGEPEEGLHLLFSTRPLEGVVAGDCGVSHTAVPALHHDTHTHTHRKKRDILSETKYIELVLVADHQEFLNYQKNNKTIIYRMLDVANQVDWFYRPLKVRVALTGLEVWSERDQIQVEKNPAHTLNNFLEWRSRELLPRLRHDNAQLVMGGTFAGTTVGMASQSSMCSRDRSGGVNVDHLVSVLGVASTVAHELGHNLGMSHDTAERRCSCSSEPRLGGCIMEPSTGFLPGQQFSSCSEADLSVSLLHGGGMCLFNMPEPERLLGGARCGNLYLEEGEECDCGLLQECQDPCCNASTCRLHPGAQCSSDGTCCQDCKLRAAGWLCREPLGECDLPEFCTGSSPLCPPNVFLQNGEHCEGGASYCYGGVCASMNAQCQTLWGPNATGAPAVCFSSVNKQGNKFGNCGQLSNGSYLPCESADVHCGRLQCQGGRERPLLGTNAEILTTNVTFNHNHQVCRGTFFHLGDDVSDPASVAEGTACGPGKACLQQRCQDVSVFAVDECRSQCHGHGVCNSNRKCHCDVGWAPPDCRYWGRGGSVDSGPASQATASDPIRVALLIIFLLVLPLILLFLALRCPPLRRRLQLLGANSPLGKARQHNRAPPTQRGNDRDSEQVRPLRYHMNPPTDIPLTPPRKEEVHHRAAAPTKPLPPNPAHPPPPQAPAPPRPVVPIKPRLLPPLPHPLTSHPPTSAKPLQLRAVAPAVGPLRRPPAPPIPPGNPRGIQQSPV